MSRIRISEISKNRFGRRSFLAGLALAGAGTVVACSSGGGAQTTGNAGGSSSSGGSAQGGSSTTVKMTDDNKFSPDTVTIAKGGTVTWQNSSSTVHTATCDASKVANKADVALPDGAQPFDSGLIQAGQSWSQTFNVAGTYKYTCIPHETLGMHGTVIVQ